MSGYHQEVNYACLHIHFYQFTKDFTKRRKDYVPNVYLYGEQELSVTKKIIECVQRKLPSQGDHAYSDGW